MTKGRCYLPIARGLRGCHGVGSSCVWALGVSERTVWRWLAEGRAGRIEARPRRGGFALSEPLWVVLAEEGGNVSALHRRMERARVDGVLENWGVWRVPSLSTLQRVVLRDLRAGRVLEVARPSRNRVEAGRDHRVLADLKLERAGEGLLVVDAGPAASTEAEADGDSDDAAML